MKDNVDLTKEFVDIVQVFVLEDNLWPILVSHWP